MFMFIPDLHMAYPIDWFAKITRRQWVKCDVHPYLQVTPWYLMKRGYSGHQYMGYCGCSNVINHTIFSCLESHPFMYGDDWGMVYEIAIPNWSKLNIFWLVVSTPLKNMKVSWDDDIPNIWKNNPNVPNHQPVMGFINRIFSRLGAPHWNHEPSQMGLSDTRSRLGGCWYQWVDD